MTQILPEIREWSISSVAPENKTLCLDFAHSPTKMQ